ncbi:hypothetical protein [Chitinophaga rhizosphaerae]|uniref:hypothetical protein n=1 Tax=Chitinophaga rhizosphaerae TaxID=1864947 RepID=UPI000F7FB38D|nr:hypothetical protein [Chitinophaga rhizosphaerae]
MILYKFINLANAKLLLSNATFKFTHPSNFNDPFDCCEDLLEYNIEQITSKEVTEDLKTIAQNLNIPLQTLID